MPASGASHTLNPTALIERQIRHWDRIAAVLKRPSGDDAPLAVVSQRPVLTVSGSLGSGRERFAVALSKELNYELFGHELMDAVASDLNCQRMLLESLDERAKSSIEVLFSSWLRDRQIEKQEYIHSLFRVMNLLAEKGGAVILGRGGAFILGEKAAFRARLEAPMETRVQRVMDGWKLDEKATRALIAIRDKEQRDFLREFFHRDVDDILAYDVTFNTGRAEPETLVPVLLEALEARGIRISRSAESKPATAQA